MRRTHLLAVISLSFVLSATTGCRPDQERDVPPRADASEQAAPRSERGDDPVEVTGCLTAGPEQKRFLLTAERNPIASASPRVDSEAPTFTYELVGGQDLGRHVNHQVTVRGRLDEEKDKAEFEQSQSKEAEPTPRGDTPTVTSTEEVEVQVRRIFIESVTPTAEGCGPADSR